MNPPGRQRPPSPTRGSPRVSGRPESHPFLVSESQVTTVRMSELFKLGE